SAITAGAPVAIFASIASAKPRVGGMSAASARISAKGRAAARAATSSALRARIFCRMSSLRGSVGRNRWFTTVCPLRRGRPGRQPPAGRMAGMIAGSALQARARRVRSMGRGADSPGAGVWPVAAIPAIGALDPGDAQLEMPVPLGATAFACRGVFGMLAPGADRVLAVPVRHGDAEPVLAAHRFDAEKTPLQARQLDHALGGRAVAVVDVGALGTEDHRVVW